MSNYKFLGNKKKIWFYISGLMFVIGVGFLFAYKLPFGIDFKGGAQFELKFNKEVTETELRQSISKYDGVSGLVVTRAGESNFILRTLPITDGQHQAISSKILEEFGDFTEQKYQLVGPSVSQDLARKAILAVVLASLFIVLYLAYSFREVSNPVSSWRFGSVAVVALLHDLIITIGVFAAVAHYYHYEVDASFITALLTVMGFSVHDTIVVFDRVRENLIKHRDDNLSFERIADTSLAETLNRSLSTSLTVVFTLGSLLLLGGESIRAFVATLLIGVIIGTYSSIFTATPLLALWQSKVAARAKRMVS